MSWMIGLGGYAFSGKDTVADYLVELGNWRKHYMSEELEKVLVALNPWIRYLTIQEMLLVHPEYAAECFNPGSGDYYADIHAKIGYNASKKIGEVRRMLQRLGTEVGRTFFGENVWVDLVRRNINQDQEQGFNIALTSIRYGSEMLLVQDFDGVTIWVERPGYGPVNDHSSDNTLGPDDFDYILANDGTLQDLAGHAVALDAILQETDPYEGVPDLLGPSLPKLRLP